MNEMTVTISVERYNELLRKETIYDIQKLRVTKDEYRCDIDSILFGVMTRSEQKAFEEALEKAKREVEEDDF